MTRDQEPEQAARLRLFSSYTTLLHSDILIIENMCGILQYFANLTESDLFINALTTNGYDSVVLKWACPPQKSLYQQSVVGELARPYNEPAVYKTLVTGEPSFGVRGVSQENVPIAQTVVPLINGDGQVIAALIMERDISEQVNQEARVESLSETAEQLARTLMGLSVNKTSFPDHLRDGVVVLDHQGKIRYINRAASRLLQENQGEPNEFQGGFLPQAFRDSPEEMNSEKVWRREIHFAGKFIRVERIPLLTRDSLEGFVLIFSDVTDLRKKEKELILKSVALQEIHHRVKNNLQNIASLLRLQMRRTDHPLLRGAFSESIHRIMTMSLVYDGLAVQNMDDVEIKELCRKIKHMLTSDLMAAECRINVEIVGNSLILPSEQAVTLSLIINELLNNALKHAFIGQNLGKVQIEIYADESNVDISVRDDGRGFQPSSGASDHLGLKIVEMLVREKLQGTFFIRQNSDSQGTVGYVRFPRKEAGREEKCQNCAL